MNGIQSGCRYICRYVPPPASTFYSGQISTPIVARLWLRNNQINQFATTEHLSAIKDLVLGLASIVLLFYWTLYRAFKACQRVTRPLPKTQVGQMNKDC